MIAAAIAGRYRHPLGFGLTAVTVWAITALLMTGPYAEDPVVTAVSLDLTLFVPVLYWLLVVRGAGAPWITVVPVFVLSVAAAPLVLPQGAEGALPVVRWIAAPAELLLLGLVARALVRARRQLHASHSADMHERIRAAARAALGHERAADIVAYELALLWYALFSWRTGTPAAAGVETFTYHRKSGHAAIVIGLLLAIAIEIIPVHLLVARWSGMGAWTVTALSLWAGLWVIGDWRAMRLRPCTLKSDRLCLRFGLRWSLDVPVTQVAAARAVDRAASAVKPDLVMAPYDAKRVRIEFAAPVEVTGVYGMRRNVRIVEAGADEPDRLLDAIARRPGASAKGRGQ